MAKYNRLISRGYRTVSGENWVDSDFGYTWTILTMVNSKGKIKIVKMKHPDDYRKIIEIEKSSNNE